MLQKSAHSSNSFNFVFWVGVFEQRKLKGLDESIAEFLQVPISIVHRINLNNNLFKWFYSPTQHTQRETNKKICQR